ncbi:MAG: phosphoglucomutase [Desulfurococcaceae archaeon]
MKLFGTAGIRMRYPGELDPLLMLKIGNAVGRLGLSSKAHVVCDTRTTSPVLALSFGAGLMSAGVDVAFVGVAPTPVAAFSARKEKSIGVSITASHNPPEYNGVKLYDPEGFEFTRTLEERIESLVKSTSYEEWSRAGNFVEASSILKEYTNSLLEFTGTPRPKWTPRVVIDCANGAAYSIVPSVVRSLGAVPVTLNCNPDGFFMFRQPEPRKDVLERFLPLYSAVESAVIFSHDGDADRVAVLDPVKGFIRQDRVLAFFAKKILEKRRGHVVVSIDTGFVVDEVVYKLGGTVERYVLGKTHERVKELGLSYVVMAGEPWKLIHTSWGPWVDGVLQVVLITKIVLETGKPFSRVLDEEGIPEYPWDRRSYLIESVEVRDGVYMDIVEDLKGALGEPLRVISIDGSRFEYEDGSWVLVRKSGTEPKIRIYAEARSRERLAEIVNKVEGIVVKAVKRRGSKVVEVTIG